jgi:sugar lactone lactonase YvrE
MPITSVAVIFTTGESPTMPDRAPAGIESIRAELVVDARASLGEGPVWDDREGCLWWVDILGETVHRTDPASGREDVLPIGRMPGAVGLRDSGGLVAAVRDGFGALDTATGRFEILVPVDAADPSMRMNDGKVDPAGRFWAGTTDMDHRPGLGTLYRLDPDLRVSPMLHEVTISNGLDWSLDGRTMYFIDTPLRRVDAFAFDATEGTITDRRAAVAIRDGAGSPDGMTLDAQGYLWVALWGGWGVERYAPDGRLDMRIEVPAEQASSCTFGGPDLDVLFITTARKGFPAAGRPDQPQAGGLFACQPGPRGRPAFRFAG